MLVADLPDFFSFKHPLRAHIWFIIILFLGSFGSTGVYSRFLLLSLTICLLLLESYFALGVILRNSEIILGLSVELFVNRYFWRLLLRLGVPSSL